MFCKHKNAVCLSNNLMQIANYANKMTLIFLCTRNTTYKIIVSSMSRYIKSAIYLFKTPALKIELKILGFTPRIT